MNYFSDQDLLSVWEFGVHHSVIETSLFLLTYGYPSYNMNQIASFSIGERDARLLHIREKLFGTTLHNTSNCTACGQKMEWETDTALIKLQAISEEVKMELFDLSYKDYQIRLRLPNSQDILELLPDDNKTTQINSLVRKCIVETTLPQEQIESIPEELMNELVMKMEEKDPQANIVMNLSCAECKNEWGATFDIMQYLWTEINDWAIQLMQDVYLLASKFGWSEKDILNMSRFRRNLYLNMIKG